ALDGLSRDDVIRIIRAFSYFSHLANIAEDQHHIRRARSHAIAGSAPRQGTFMLALERARKAGIERRALEEFFVTALVCPVLTAHPTEVQRKSPLDREREVARLLAERSLYARWPAIGLSSAHCSPTWTWCSPRVISPSRRATRISSATRRCANLSFRGFGANGRRPFALC